jgi:hypothetical protein
MLSRSNRADPVLTTSAPDPVVLSAAEGESLRKSFMRLPGNLANAAPRSGACGARRRTGKEGEFAR